MKHWRLAGSTALALILASAASAEITPDEVWRSWQNLGAEQGQTITAKSTSHDGTSLVAEGVTIQMKDAETSVEGVIDRVVFADQGDGTVAVTMSDSYPMTLTVTDTTDAAAPKPVTLKLTVTQPGLKVVASGTAASPTYAFDAPEFGVKLDSLEGPGTETMTAAGEVKFTGIKGSYAFAAGEGTAPMALDSTFTAAGMTMDISGADSAAKSDFKAKVSVADLNGSTKGAFLDAAAMENMNKALQDGFFTDSQFSYGKTSFEFGGTEDGKPTTISGEAASGGVGFVLNKETMGFKGNGSGVTMTVAGGDMPFPSVSVSYSEAAFDLGFPVAKSDAPQPFTFLARLVDLKLPDELLGMVDPTAQLPRDPATLIVDSTGTVTLTTDLTDDAAMAALGDAPPGTLDSLDLKQILLKAAGAELRGSGAMTFDNTDLETYGGMPAPTGTIDLKLVGGNTLLDKIVALGFVTQDDAMGVRMMMSMFGKMVEGEPDTMTSTVEFKDKGINVNGQKIQ